MKEITLKNLSNRKILWSLYWHNIFNTPFIKQLKQKLKHLLFNSKQQQAFLEDIAMLVQDGIALNQAVAIVNKTATGLLAEVANTVLVKLAEGQSFAAGLKGWFSMTVVEVLRAGEEGGTLTRSMMAATEILKQRNTVISSLINSLAYPITVMCLGFIVAIFINNSVFQSFAVIKPISQWPSNGQTAVALANFIENYWWWALIILISCMALLAQVLRNYIGEARSAIDNLPILSLYRKLTAARFMEILALLILNGVVFRKALKILQQTANPYLASHLLMMEYRLSGGKENIAEVLDTGLLDKMDLLRLRIVARGKSFEHALLRHGRRAAADSIERVHNTGKIIGSVLLVLSAGLAAFLVFSIYSVGATLGGL